MLRKKKKQAAEGGKKKKKSELREWGDALLFALIVATIVRWLIMEPFTIPSSSMEKSLMTGDYLFVSKYHYGSRTPITPIHMPLTANTFWGTDIPSYIDWIQLPYRRLPGFSGVRHGDAVVFNFPTEDKPVDMKTFYIKRCIALPGDELEVKDLEVFINGESHGQPEEMQMKYIVETKNNQPLSDAQLRKLEIYEFDNGGRGSQRVVLTTKSTAQKLTSIDFVKSVTPALTPRGSADFGAAFQLAPNAYPDWSMDNFGPLVIPSEGYTVTLTPELVGVYQYAIRNYEGHENTEVKSGKLFIDGQEVTEYTFTQDYYWMMGDNRHNSSDSRVWGFVPRSHVLGKAVLIWWSVTPREYEPKKGFFGRVRWDRVFKLVN